MRKEILYTLDGSEVIRLIPETKEDYEEILQLISEGKVNTFDDELCSSFARNPESVKNCGKNSQRYNHRYKETLKQFMKHFGHHDRQELKILGSQTWEKHSTAMSKL